MAKGKGFDPIADAHELAEHNINPYYWVNKVTSYTYARWMAEKKMAVILLPLYVIAWVAVIHSFREAAASKDISIWSLILDFTNGYTLYSLVQLLFLALYTGIVVIMVLQMLLSPPQKPAPTDVHSQKKRKLPKRRKDYH